MENLKTLVYNGNITSYQKALAQREFEGLIERIEMFEKSIENKVGINLSALVLCKDELFFNCTDGTNIYSIYPCTIEKGEQLANMIGVDFYEH